MSNHDSSESIIPTRFVFRYVLTAGFVCAQITVMSPVAAEEPGSYIANIDMQLFAKADMYSKVTQLIHKGTSLALDDIPTQDSDMQHVTFKNGQGWIRLDESDLRKIR